MISKDDYKKRYKQSHTRKRYADTLIDLGSKFYFAAFTLPLVYYIKHDEIDFKLFCITLASLLILGFGGTFFQKYGLSILDNIKEK